MDDVTYRNNSIAEEDIDPDGHPAKNELEERDEDVAEWIDLGYRDGKMKPAQKRKKLIKETDRIIKEDPK